MLVISNRAFSSVDNNGKTLYSVIAPLSGAYISQLYFYGNLPTIPGYNYFQLSDKDVLLGKFKKARRGRNVDVTDRLKTEKCSDFTITSRYRIKRRDSLLLLRELLWKNSWKSEQLDAWLDQIRPDVVFFMAGDCLYAYSICAYVINRYPSRLITYVTDDYVLPRHHETGIAKFRRQLIADALGRCVSRSETFYTVCERMRLEYQRLFNKDSKILFNMTKSLWDGQLCRRSEQNDRCIITYAGSLYYGRDEVLLKLAEVLKQYNSRCGDGIKAWLVIYSNWKPDKTYLKKLYSTRSARFGGSLDQTQLKRRLNLSNLLVFVESSEPSQIEKTRLSFSTKIPEYLSLGKPVLAIGPEGTGSMDYLEDAAVIINNPADMYEKISMILKSDKLRKEYAAKAQKKYSKYINAADGPCVIL